MPYFYPYISIYRGPKKGEELKKYLISHMKSMDEVAENNKTLSMELNNLLTNFNLQQAESNREINHLTALLKVLQKTVEESQVSEI